ncbi:hypothetical protein HNQ91_005971 [Filimonas zeae]|nr:hypothetical protein [Filimonas zeae]
MQKCPESCPGISASCLKGPKSCRIIP